MNKRRILKLILKNGDKVYSLQKSKQILKINDVCFDPELLRNYYVICSLDKYGLYSSYLYLLEIIYNKKFLPINFRTIFRIGKKAKAQNLTCCLFTLSKFTLEGKDLRKVGFTNDKKILEYKSIIAKFNSYL